MKGVEKEKGRTPLFSEEEEPDQVELKDPGSVCGPCHSPVDPDGPLDPSVVNNPAMTGGADRLEGWRVPSCPSPDAPQRCEWEG